MLYARSDLSSVIIPVVSGGCNNVHSRPVTDGAPVALWQLTCPQCETVLKGHPHWAGTATDIPETPDEQRSREDYEKRGAQDQNHMMALALGKIAGVDLPDSLTRVTSGAKAHIPVVACPGGHANPAGVKFCGECGQSMHGQAPVATTLPDPGPPLDAPSVEYAVDSYTVADVPLPDEPASDGPDLAAMQYSDLRKLAVSRGLPSTGTKADLLERLSAAA